MSWTGVPQTSLLTSPGSPPPPLLLDLIYSRRSAKRRTVSRCWSPRDKARPFAARHKRSVVFVLAAMLLGSNGTAWAQTCDAAEASTPISQTESGGTAASPAHNCVNLNGGTIAADTNAGEGVRANHEGYGDIDIDAQGVTITTEASAAAGILATHNGVSGTLDINVQDSSITTSGLSSDGIFVQHSGSGDPPGDISVSVRSSTITTLGNRIGATNTGSGGIYVEHGGGYSPAPGNIDITVRDSSITTTDNGIGFGPSMLLKAKSTSMSKAARSRPKATVPMGFMAFIQGWILVAA